MKTAMNQLFEWLENSSDIKNDILDWDIVKENALEKEKEQIMNAAHYGHTIKNEFYDAETYYYQTYQNK